MKEVGRVYAEAVRHYRETVCRRCEFVAHNSSLMRCADGDAEDELVQAVEPQPVNGLLGWLRSILAA